MGLLLLLGLVLFLLVVSSSPQALVSGAEVLQQQQQQQQQTQSTPPRTAKSFIDHGISLLNLADRVSLDWLQKQTGGDMTTGAFESVIQSKLAPVDTRKVL